MKNEHAFVAEVDTVHPRHGGLGRFLTRLGQSRQQHAGKNGDDGNHHQKFDEGEPGANAIPDGGGWWAGDHIERVVCDLPYSWPREVGLSIADSVSGRRLPSG
jgi:hypothetical protein